MIPDYEQHLSDYIAELNRQMRAVTDEEWRLKHWAGEKQREFARLSTLRDEAQSCLYLLRKERGHE